MIRGFQIFLFSLFCWLNSAAQNVLLQDGNSAMPIGKHVYYFEDESADITASEASETFFKNQFKANNQTVFVRSATASVYWFAFTCEHLSKELFYFSTGSTYPLYVDIYRIAEDRIPHLYAKSCAFREATDLVYHAPNAYWLPLIPDSSKITNTYLIRVSQHYPFELPFQLGTFRALQEANQAVLAINYGHVGMMLIMGFYYLFLLFMIKERIYIIYILYIFSGIIGNSFLNCFPIGVWLFGNPEFFYSRLPFWLNPAILTIVLFCVQYLELKKRAPIFYALIWIGFGLFTLVGLANIFDWLPPHVCINLTQAILMVLYVFCIASGFYLWIWKKFKIARFYTLAWSSFFIAAFVFLAVMNGFLPYNLFTRNVIIFGEILEVLFFALSLGDKYASTIQAFQESLDKNLQLSLSRNKVLTELVWQQSHQLRRPIANVLGILKILKSENDLNSDERDSFISHLEDEIDAADEAVHQMVKKLESLEK